MRPFELSQRLTWAAPLPDQFKTPYALGNYDRDRVSDIMWKYLVRQVNCQRAWVRLNHHMPEALVGGPLDVLELSTAHGATLEILRSFGHRVVGNDYPWVVEGADRRHKGERRSWHRTILDDVTAVTHDNPVADPVEGWPYQPIIESLGLDVRLFDGGAPPYPFDDDSVDHVVSYQAIEAYGGPDRWLDFIREMCRIARKAVVVGFNPLPIQKYDGGGTVEDARAAWLALQRFDERGFRPVHFEIGQTRRGIHPTCVKLMAL